MKLKEKIRYGNDWTYLTLYEQYITNFISCQIFIIYFGARNWAELLNVKLHWATNSPLVNELIPFKRGT